MSTIAPSAAIAAMRDYGVDVRPYPFDSRPWYEFTTAGSWNPHGIMHHHTAGSAALLTPGSASQRATLRLLRIGRSDLDGPLCHFAPTFNGNGKRAIVYAIGWGNTNHAGRIAANVYGLLHSGTYDGEKPGLDGPDGNAVLYGFEYLHPGDATRWPDELLDAGHRAAAALCDAHGWEGKHGPGSNCEHREATRRKVDRSWSGWGDGMRKEVGTILAAGPRDDPNDGWSRPDTVSEAIRLLNLQARAYEASRRPNRAKVLREEAQRLAERFPITKEG